MRIAFEGPLGSLSPGARAALLRREPGDTRHQALRVAAIVDRVRRFGDSALLEMARELDGVSLGSLEVPRSRWQDALDSLDLGVRRALERAARNIRIFHEAQTPTDIEIETEPGVRVGRKAVPLDTVGVYAPGGRAAYPSSVLMGVVPARAAGVETIVVCSPPGPDGEPNPAVLAACALVGASRVFATGGAGAVAAMAYGTESVPRCAAVVGPGNRWVTEAKRQVAGEVRIDSPAGPSEVLVVADDGASPELVAAELVAQAEHDPDAAVVCVGTSAAFLEEVRGALAGQVAVAPRREVIEVALASRGALLLAADLDEALAFADDFAAEHLALHTADPRRDAERVRTAGTVFLGQASAVAFGDYATGANHVLPTAGLARSFSGLSVLHFLRFYTYQELTPEAARDLAEPVALLAGAEGLPGHAASVRMRRGS